MLFDDCIVGTWRVLPAQDAYSYALSLMGNGHIPIVL